MKIYILAFCGSILFIIILKDFLLKIFKLNSMLIFFTFILMGASIFQKKLEIEITTETLVLILFNFLVINYENIIEVMKKIKKIKLGGVELELEDYKVKKQVESAINKYNTENNKVDPDRNIPKNIFNSEDNRVKFLYNYSLIESAIKKIYFHFFSDRFVNRNLSLNEMYLKIIREDSSINFKVKVELKKAYPVIKTMRILRNRLVHNIQNANFNDINYEELFIIQEEINSNLQSIINEYNIKN